MAKFCKTLAMLLAVCVVSTVAFVQLRHRLDFGHFVPVGLHSDVSAFRTDIGIPGITKLYEAHITNFGIVPRRIERCEFVTDASAHEVSIGYRLELWDKLAARWKVVVDANAGYCRPYPLGIARASLVSKLLWPGQTLSTGAEATGARGNLKGEVMRFVVVANNREYPTASFVIDEQIKGTDAGYRVRH